MVYSEYAHLSLPVLHALLKPFNDLFNADKTCNRNT